MAYSQAGSAKGYVDGGVHGEHTGINNMPDPH